MRVLSISGSLRRASYNRGLLRAAQELAPPGWELVTHEIGDLPPFDGDVEADGTPEPVERLRRAIAEADAIVIATPEYNRGTSGVLKNAVDWASRPARRSVLDGKPVLLVGATTGIGGTARAQQQVRDALAFSGAQTAPGGLQVARAREKFDEAGSLLDVATRMDLAGLLEALDVWAADVRAALADAALGRAA